MTDTPAPEPTDEDVFEQKAVRLAKRERLIAERADAAGGAYPVSVPDHRHDPRSARALRRPRGRCRDRSDRRRRRPRRLQPQHRQALLRDPAGRRRQPHPGDGVARRRRRGVAPGVEGARRPRRPRLRLGRGHLQPPRRAVDHGRGVGDRLEGDPAAAEHVRRAQRGEPRPQPVPRPHRARPRPRDRRRPREGQREPAGDVHRRGFLEVETPMLQVQHGGASARPFVTNSNAFDADLYLRIAPELFLKRAVVGGIDRVFEINRNFRNEGADSTHSPEFAMLEAYEAYSDYNGIADLTQELIQNAAIAVAGSTTVTWADGTEYDLGGQWERLSMYGSLSEASGRAVTPRDVARRAARARGRGRGRRAAARDPRQARRGAVGALRQGRPHPADVRDGLPARHEPARARAPLDPGRGREVGPVRPRLRARDRLLRAHRPGHPARALRRAGEARRARRPRGDAHRRGVPPGLEHGMPPMGGMGMGIDRLLMAITGLGIRETILFPLVK